MRYTVASDSYGGPETGLSSWLDAAEKEVVTIALNKERSARAFLGVAFLALFTLSPRLRAADVNDDFDIYKLRIEGFWFYSNPSGTIQGAGDTVPIDFKRDLGFNSYSTFAGKLDWKFTRKNHLTFAASPFDQSRQTFLTRTIVFKGQTFDVGVATHAQLKAPLFAPGYQYDIIRRKRGHLGIAVQIDLFNATGSITSTAQVSGGAANQQTVSAKSSLLAPIPVAGPQFRFYLTNSPRLFVEGNVYGMYLFGYGNFVSTADTLGLTLAKHLSVNAGYQLGTRLVVNNKSDRFGIHLTQKGPIAGLEFSF